MAAWQISGEYMETCNCAFLCPCISSNLAAPPTEGDCKAAVTMRIDKGSKDGVTLDGLSFIVMLYSPGPMGEGNMTVGLIIDTRATPQQVEAITAIATGSVGGPMAALAGPTTTNPPILLIVNSAAPNRLGPYLGEILRAEGLNAFSQAELSSVTAAQLAEYDLAILVQTPLTSAQASVLTSYVSNGGALLATQLRRQRPRPHGRRPPRSIGWPRRARAPAGSR